MPFYMNFFDTEFRGSIAEVTQSFIVKGNVNSSHLLSNFNAAPYDLSANASLTINYSFDFGKSWTALVIDVTTTAASTSAVLADEVVSALNANTTFTALFTASVNIEPKTPAAYVVIRAVRTLSNFKVYISNTSAETVLKFNKKAGVTELPSYFGRHTINNVTVFADSLGVLLLLNTGVAADQAIITAAGLDYTTTQADWQLFGGRSSKFTFTKNTVDGSNRVTQAIVYPAGAKVGDLAKKITYLYSGSNTTPNQSAEVPYIIASGDLITP